MRDAFLCFLRVNIIQEDNCLFKYSKIPHIQPFLLNSPPNFEVDQFPNADKAIKSKSRSTPPGTAKLTSLFLLLSSGASAQMINPICSFV